MNKNLKVVDYSEKVLEVKNLKKYFYVGGGRKKFAIPAVDNVSFDVYKREVFGLVGESGCGKTTTGRTIIKLYNPTEGTVVLNGVTIGAGYANHIQNIKKIKEEAKHQIVLLDEAKVKSLAIRDESIEKIALLKIDLEKIDENLEKDIKKASKVTEDYKDKIYDLKTQLKLDIEKAEFEYLIKRTEIINRTNNTSEVEFNNEVQIAKVNYERKASGLKDSAALNKETIQTRLANLKAEYQNTVQSLQVAYAPKIEADNKNLLSKPDARLKVSELLTNRTKKIAELKARFDQNKKALVLPDPKLIKSKIDGLKSEAKQQKLKIKAAIQATKKETNERIKTIPKTQISGDALKERNERIRQIWAEALAKINEEKEIIRETKHVNNAKDTLLASQKMQMIFQDPISSLNPRMTVKEIIGEGLTIQGGYTKEEITARVEEVLDLVGLAPEYASRYPHEFSGGQRQRIGIARALIMNPNVIIADEPISSLDVSIRAQVINLLRNLKEKLGLTVLFIAHDLSVVKFFCDRIAVMYYGKIVELATSEELFKNPMHPYTISLLSAIPQPDPDYEKGRQRIHYNPQQHNYRIDKASLREISEGHLVYANKAEFKEMQLRYGKKTDQKAV